MGDPLRLAIVEALLLGDLAPDELSQAVGMPSNAMAHHLAVLDDAGVVRRHRSQGDARRRYLLLQGESLGDLVTPPTIPADSVLFVCTANAARSQLAQALWREVSDVPADSAGRDPAPQVAAGARRVASAAGLDLGGASPRGFDAVERLPGLVVSVCDRAREATIPFDVPRLHWSIPDPLGGPQEAFTEALEEIRARVAALAPQVRPA